MKHVFTFFLTLALTAGMAHAQSTATVTQKDGATATVDQATATVGHEAVVDQAGVNNADVDQTGDNHYAEVLQGVGNPIYGGTAGGTATGNEAIVDQAGANHQASIIQGTDGGTATGAYADISQSGTGGVSSIYQGNAGTAGGTVGSSAVISQVAVTGGEANIRQGLVGTSTDDQATLNQTGTGNYAFIVQGFGGNSTSLNNVATINQEGSSNWTADIRQGSTPFSGPPSYGSGNTATIDQFGDGAGAANSGEARVWQGVDGGSATGNTGYILQETGTFGNDAQIYQGVGDGVSASSSVAEIYQYSDSNIATVTQSGDGNSATVTQQD